MFKVGSVVQSKAGRDKSKIFMVVKVQNEDYVLIADGEIKKLSKPKLKKIKHLKATGDNLDSIAAKLLVDSKVFDAELKSALKKLIKAEDTEVKGV